MKKEQRLDNLKKEEEKLSDNENHEDDDDEFNNNNTEDYENNVNRTHLSLSQINF